MKALNKTFAIIMALCLILAVIPMNAFAYDEQESILYLDRFWTDSGIHEDLFYCEDYTNLSSYSSLTLTDGWYVLDEDKTYNSCLNITGDVHLILTNEKTLSAHDGIYIKKDSTLTVYQGAESGGKILADPGDHDNGGPGIGGIQGSVGGNLVVKGGTIEAHGGSNAAGIGGGNNESSGFQSISIYGGTINSYGGSYGAGIGTGDDNKNNGVITIYDGIIEAHGGKKAAGIGGGDSCSGGDIIIYGDYKQSTIQHANYNGYYIVAYGGDDGAGIGGGEGGDGGNITIHGGIIYSKSGSNAAGIGGGDEGGDGGNITINRGCVCAVGIHEAGIGGGDEGDGENITINGGYILAESHMTGAGIGGGVHGDSGTVTITGGDVQAFGGYDGSSGIGGGKSGSSNTINISGGKVYAKGNNEGAGIGGGYDKDCGNVNISGGTVEAIGGLEGGSGIGAGYAGSLYGTVRISGGNVTARGNGGGAGIGGGCEGHFDDGGEGGTVYITGGKVLIYVNGSEDSTDTTEASPIGGGTGDGNDGDLYLASNYMVKAGTRKSTATLQEADNRESACHSNDNNWVLIETCNHQDLTYEDNADTYHTVNCKYCDHSYTEDHTFSDGECICGHDLPVVYFDQGMGYGTMDPETVQTDLTYKLPACGFESTGLFFQAWDVSYNDGSGYIGKFYAGETLTVTKDIICTALYTENEMYQVIIPESISRTILDIYLGFGNLYEGETAKIFIQPGDDFIQELYYIDVTGRQFNLLDKVSEPYETLDLEYNTIIRYDCEFTMPKSDVTVYVVLGDEIIVSTGITLNESELTLGDGDTFTLVATVEPDNATNKTVTWTSSDESVATVDDNGNVTAVDCGEAVITATTADGKQSASCNITIPHVWEFDSFEWIGSEADGYTNVYAKYVCQNNSEHTEFIEAELTKDILSPTCTEDGITTYTAAISDENSLDGLKHNETKRGNPIPAEHDWGSWEELDEEYHQRVCQNDDSHVETEPHSWDEGEITTPATCTEDGVMTYTCTVCQATKIETIPATGQFVYFNESGDGSTWTKGSSEPLEFSFKRSLYDSSTYDRFTGIQVDGEDVGTDKYTAESGSVVIKLNADYLETLEAGDHTIKAVFNDGEAEAGFKIAEKPFDPVDTGDHNDFPAGLVFSIMILSLIAIIVLAYTGRKYE